MAGDTNGDRRVDSLDLLAVNALLASGGYDQDADGDGVINSLDRLLVMRGKTASSPRTCGWTIRRSPREY